MTQERLQRRLKYYRLDHVIRELPELPTSNAGMALSPENPALTRNIVWLEPRDLHDLKAWVGIPNDQIDHEKHGVKLKPVELAALPKKAFEFRRLSERQQHNVSNHAYNLLMGFVPPAWESKGPHRHVIGHVLQSARKLPMLVASDLTVGDGQTYTISVPAATFNTVTIIGSGSIVLMNDVKLICDQLTYQAT